MQLLQSNRYDMSNDFYDALFDYKVDCYEKQLYCIVDFNKSNSNIDHILSITLYKLIKAFVSYNKNSTSKSTERLIRLCSSFQIEILNTISHKSKTVFDVAPFIKKRKAYKISI